MPGATTPPPTTDLLTPHGRLAALAAARCERFGFGSALSAPELPRVRDMNCVRFEHRDDSLTAEELVAVVDRVQAGGAHRWCEIWDTATAERLLPALEALGAPENDRILLMEAPNVRELRPQGQLTDVRRVGWRELDGLYEEWLLSEDVFARDDDLREQIAEARRVRFAAAPTDAWCVLADDGAPVAMAHLMRHDGFAMIEDVYVTERCRRHGFGAACVTAAVRAARADGADPVFLPTDDVGAAPRFYATLGFTRGPVITRVLTRQ